MDENIKYPVTSKDDLVLEQEIANQSVGKYSDTLRTNYIRILQRQLWPNDPIFTIEGETKENRAELEKIISENEIATFGQMTEEYMFDRGEAGWTIDIDSEGKWLFTMTGSIIPVYRGQKLIHVTSITRFVRGARAFIVTEERGLNKVTRTFAHEKIQLDSSGVEMGVVEGSRKNFKNAASFNKMADLNLKDEWVHNLGIVPFVHLKENTTAELRGRAAFAGQKAKLDMLDLMWFRMTQMVKYDKPQLGTFRPPGGAPFDASQTWEDIALARKQQFSRFEAGQGSILGNDKHVLIPSTMDLTALSQEFMVILDDINKSTGFYYSAEKKGSFQQNQTEIFGANAMRLESFRLKAQTRSRAFEKLFEVVIAYEKKNGNSIWQGVTKIKCEISELGLMDPETIIRKQQMLQEIIVNATTNEMAAFSITKPLGLSFDDALELVKTFKIDYEKINKSGMEGQNGNQKNTAKQNTNSISTGEKK